MPLADPIAKLMVPLSASAPPVAVTAKSLMNLMVYSANQKKDVTPVTSLGGSFITITPRELCISKLDMSSILRHTPDNGRGVNSPWLTRNNHFLRLSANSIARPSYIPTSDSGAGDKI